MGYNFSEYKNKVLPATQQKKKTYYKRSNFNIDKEFEETSIQYLKDKTKLFDIIKVKEIVAEKERQLKGVDLVCYASDSIPSLNKNSNEITIDIKACASEIPTFCFEIENTKSGYKGWLFDETKITDYYLLAYHTIKGCEKEYNKGKLKMSTENVLDNSLILLERKKVQNYILSYLHDTESINNCVDIIKNIIKDKNNWFDEDDMLKKVIRFELKDRSIKMVDKISDDATFYFTFSTHLKEKPINLIIKRSVLEQLSNCQWKIDEKGTILQF